MSRRPIRLLDLFLLEKAAYEVAYEAANRPDWIAVPIAGLARAAARLHRTGERMMAYDDALGPLMAAAARRAARRSLRLARTASRAGRVVRTFQPGAESVALVARDDGRPLGTLEDQGGGLFAGRAERGCPLPPAAVTWPGGSVQETEDVYGFGIVLGDLDLHLFGEGRHWDLGRVFGAQPKTVDGVDGVSFAVWAPAMRGASRLSANSTAGTAAAIRCGCDTALASGSCSCPGSAPERATSSRSLGADGSVVEKADPLARATELPPATASIVAPVADYRLVRCRLDGGARAHASAPTRRSPSTRSMPARGCGPRAIRWARSTGAGSSERLIPYVAEMGFTHVELLPIMEHPFAGSWGYQPLSQFAPSSRFGTPADFAHFVDECHRAGIGVILDWVPAHFPTDAHGLAHFDGTHLYEHADPREGFHQDWNTLIYNLGRREVAGTLLASGLWWLETFHVDGLRVDAVASMLYRDYSRKAGEWVPNRYGGRENLESVEFLKRLNILVAERCPGAITLAEESTAWPGVSAPVSQGGLGFSYKWNMGWMHDTLQYVERDPMHRGWHHSELTFGIVYAFSERFVSADQP